MLFDALLAARGRIFARFFQYAWGFRGLALIIRQVSRSDGTVPARDDEEAGIFILDTCVPMLRSEARGPYISEFLD